MNVNEEQLKELEIFYKYIESYKSQHIKTDEYFVYCQNNPSYADLKAELAQDLALGDVLSKLEKL